MVSVSGTNITMTRGDTARIQIAITDPSGEVYTPAAGDKIRFAAKKKYTDGEPLLLIDIPVDSMELVIKPEDTKPLEFGSYKYDIELTQENGTVDTFIDKATLTITEEVY